MLSLAALACDQYRAPIVSITHIDADPERPGIAYIDVSTTEGEVTTFTDTQPQSFEISDYGYAWNPIERSVAHEIPDEHVVQMDQHRTLLIDGTTVWTYSLPTQSDWMEIRDPRIRLEGTFPTAFNWYLDGESIYPVPGPPPLTPLDYAISPADPNVMYVAMYDLGVLVGPAPGTDSNRGWELHILKSNGFSGAVDPAESGSLLDVDMVLAIDERGTLEIMLWALLLSLLPASLLHRWIITRYWRQHGFSSLQNEFAWLLWLYALIQTVMSALLWLTGFVPSSLTGGVIIASLLIAIFTALATYALGQVNGYTPAALKKPVITATLYTAITPVLWGITLLGLLLWPVFGVIVLSAWLWKEAKKRRKARQSNTSADSVEIESECDDQG